MRLDLGKLAGAKLFERVALDDQDPSVGVVDDVLDLLVLKLDIDTVIPGHGNDPVGKAELQAWKTRLDTISRIAIDLVKKGTPKDQLIAAIGTADATVNVGAILQNNPARIDAFYEDVVKAAK